MRILLLLVATLLTFSTLTIAGPASADTSTAPTVSTPSVARGHKIKVRVAAHGSKLVGRTSTLWRNGHRVRDWSPKPGRYKVKSVLSYQKRTTGDVWVPWDNCADYSTAGYDENGDGDFDDAWDDSPYDGCAEGEYGDWQESTTLSATKKVTRYTYARVFRDETPGCVSLSEFRAVKNGMTKARVHGIFGTKGHVTSSGSGGSTREYRPCTGDPDWSYVEVDYDPRVWFKWRYISY